jgi:hypothetical protein
MPAAGSLGLSDCESIRDGLLAQPVNAVSSLAFVAAAGAVLRLAGREGGPRGAIVGAYGASLLAVGVGSFAYHGPQPAWAQQAHDAPIPVVVFLALVVLAGAWRVRERRQRGIRVLGATLGMALLAYVAGRTGSPLCVSDSLWQPHALWHVLAATVAVLVARLLPRACTSA